VGYPCANFGLPRPLCSQLRPDVRDRQTNRRQSDIRQTAPSLKGGSIIIELYASHREHICYARLKIVHEMITSKNVCTVLEVVDFSIAF